MTDLGEVKNLLGMEVQRLKDGSVFISQERYIEEIARRFSIAITSSFVYTPMMAKLTGSDEPVDVANYLQRGGSIAWPALGTRPDIAYAVSYLGRFNSEPQERHHLAQERVLEYLLATKS